ncbi:MAG: helix-turn-helix domain-containing protein [Symploca sp. SIO3C6]|uniref:Helix-turn-helix domain-containing protein n=1 Tax=Symploca sp. SIO1C4 TaxID=2607765 RepID=A0A6B3NBP5_9CYAN|nr:helix-turn-helix domain-containing protein [Symploca sp. SIO3C6]NER28012.1 helix-turn-helix domain-containing protein [Symploca sp. SIO1C4]NET03783.1 helix-turn-helix domain-containing protein [Symploca sp. SIO2B6]NET52663.1 helix-turn-helix domain-containing protein [Merismopedia sp. SIO2A8]
MLVGTAQAAELLGISTARVRLLLKQGRIEGAYKIGRFWVIPLFDGMPVISKGRRGPKGRWCRRRPAVTFIHVNQHAIRQNKKQGHHLPVISIKKGNSNVYGHEVRINGPCRVVYQPNLPKPCGARVWIETLSNVEVIDHG